MAVVAFWGAMGCQVRRKESKRSERSSVLSSGSAGQALQIHFPGAMLGVVPHACVLVER